MNRHTNVGMTLVELLVAMSIASIAGAIIMQLVISFQSRVFAEIRRNDLHDRTERLIRFMANDISDTAFLLGAEPRVANGSRLILTHDSLPGDPQEEFSTSIVPQDVSAGDDRLTFVKAESFTPPLLMVQDGAVGDYLLPLNRRPNRSPGSTREIVPGAEAINHLVFANHPLSYAVVQADQTLEVVQPLVTNVPAGTEVLGVRAYSYYLDSFSGSNRLRRDNYTSRTILDDAVDGLQFEYLLKDGELVNQPLNLSDVRGVKVSLLTRDLNPDKDYTNEDVYSLGNRTYGPFRDHYRRHLAERMIEVKNYAL